MADANSRLRVSAFMIVLVQACVLGIGIDSSSIAAEESPQPTDKPASASSGQEPESTQRPLKRFVLGATPEERARLDAERRRLSGEAASFGVDPTAIVGFYQFLYGHSSLSSGVRVDTATPSVRVPITPNLLFQVTMPYAWADKNQSNVFPLRGAGDMTTRMGGRIFANEKVALFVGFDASFPTASERQLGTGKYTLGPGGSLAIPLPRMRSLFNLVALDYNSVGGDPSRTDLHFLFVQPAVYTFWTEHWLTGAVMTWAVDWDGRRKTTMNLLGEVGYRFADHWILFAGPGVGVVGKETFLGMDWMVQGGVRWVFRTSLISEKLIESMPRK